MPAKATPLHPEWLDALRNPATYSHSVSQIQLVETHISWVALTGEWAYKLKKPVNFGFVDFTTLELRQAACHEEVRLNRRTAPDIYDDVLPLTSDQSGPRFGGTGPVLDYAVRMRQFAQEDMLDQCLARGELSVDIIETLAREVARLHRQADVASIDSPFSTPESIHKSVQDCLNDLSRRTMSDDCRTQLDQLKGWTNAEWNRLKRIFVQRKQQGWVRECHGDLHLGNLVLYRGRPTLFDCLEFNPELRWTDVICDVAFLVMDLHDRGAPHLAWRALNEWLEQTGDYEGLKVLNYYLAYRALVRAKVAALRLQQPELSPAETRQHQQHLHSYMDLASTLSRANQSAIVLMHGLSGSGKSFVARRLASSVGAIQIRSDVERKRLFGIWPASFPSHSSLKEMYGPDATRQTYQRLQTLARDIIQAGYTVIVDAVSLQREQRQAFALIAEELAIPFMIVACVASEQVLRERVLQRQSIGRDASDADVAVLEKQFLALEPIHGSESSHTIVMNTATDDLESVIQVIQKRLRDVTEP